MPNWTSNSIRIEGAEADIRAFLDAVKWQDQIFDFNRIIPMPELLKNTSSGFRTIDGEEVTAWYAIGPGDQEVRRFTPDEAATLAEIGYSNWYDWSVASWGTKWNACHPRIEDESSIEHGYVEITFDTAWCAPELIFRKMFDLFPALSFICSWQDEGDDTCKSIGREAVDGSSKTYTLLSDQTDEAIETLSAADFTLWLAGAELLAAAEKVVSRWEKGDLAEAVRELGAAIDNAKGRAP